ncbi:MAG: thiamine ABC transporter substrate-binding protein [Pseudonocardiaceae bacterium]|nr:thiamine ABC transporter substrate-binding protein [Pseudonocardiaceae bacterium]
MPTRRGATTIAVAASLIAATTLAGCTLLGENGNGNEGGGESARTVTLVTHDSFAAPRRLLDSFQRESGIRIKVQKSGDAGALTNKLVLTKDNPIGDVAYGVDSTFASRALNENIFQPYASPQARSGPQRYAVDNRNRMTAIDIGDVCVNIDTRWFAARGIPEPSSYADLTKPRYRNQLVVQDAATSSPGLAFLLGTVAEYGQQGWSGYWAKLKANGVKVVSGWEEAYGQDFSGSSGNGPRPIVVSYASSPAAEVGEDGAATTKALPDTCYRQVEYAGVLAGAKNRDGARKVVDFLLSERFQASVPDSMYVYPTRHGVQVPETWSKVAPLPDRPDSLPPGVVQANRERWVAQWRGLVRG